MSDSLITRNRRLLLELCAGGIEDVHLAARLAVDRIELNCGMAVGGLTPPAGLVNAAREIFAGPVISMIRPREGGFCYSTAEHLQMQHDAEWMLENGINGLAVGFLTSTGMIDVDRCAGFRRLFPTTELVFHKAFDVTPDLETSVRQLVDCGFNRILTSGGMSTAFQGISRLAELIKMAAAEIEILPGGGIRAGNVEDLFRMTGCNQIHSAVRSVVRDPSTRHNESFQFGIPGGDSGSFSLASAAQLQELLNVMDQLQT